MDTSVHPDPFGARSTLTVDGRSFRYYRLDAAGMPDLARVPFTVKVLLENVLRHAGGGIVTEADVRALAAWRPGGAGEAEVPFMPARVILQDFTGVPAVVDLAAMRDAMADLGGDPAKINPLVPADLVIDHSVQVDRYGTADAFTFNVNREYERNGERYQLLRWAQTAFQDLRVVPPGTGIIHQVNLEYLASVVMTQAGADGVQVAFPDTLVGTDSHTTMISGLGILGYGVGGIEAEAVLLGQPLYQPLPRVVGVRLSGELPRGSTATDLVLVISQMLRKHGVVGAFVEFAGDGLAGLSLADRATIANMSPEYGATTAIFPIDDETLAYLRLTGRDAALVSLVEAYAKTNGMWREPGAGPDFDEALELDLATVLPSVAGPRRPQDRVVLSDLRTSFRTSYPSDVPEGDASPLAATAAEREQQAIDAARTEVELASIASMPASDAPSFAQDPETHEPDIAVPDRVTAIAPDKPYYRSVPVVGVDGVETTIGTGSVAIAAITSCTNTSNPSVMLAAGLLARNAVAKGLTVSPTAKTSLAPGSRAVTQYLQGAGLLEPLAQLGFDVVGYGCTTCIGNSGPLDEPVAKAIEDNDLVVAAVLSGNRNFEGRIHPFVRASYLASPPLVVAFALAGRVDIDLTTQPLGTGSDGQPVYLADIWPSPEEVKAAIAGSVSAELFRSAYASVFEGDEQWRSLPVPTGDRYVWDGASTYIARPPFFEGLTREPAPISDIEGARVLAVLGDSVTTDHISPAGSIPTWSPAGRWLEALGVTPYDFNSYGARRGHHEVMMRGTFGNIRLKNALASKEGPYTTFQPSGEEMFLYGASIRYQAEGTPLVILAGQEYGSGSSRDWAAKGTRLLGVRAVIAQSYERIHRSNLVGMGVLPLQFLPGESAQTLGLTGREALSIGGLADDLAPRKTLRVTATALDGSVRTFDVICRLDGPIEVDYYRQGGILPAVLRRLADA